MNVSVFSYKLPWEIAWLVNISVGVSAIVGPVALILILLKSPSEMRKHRVFIFNYVAVSLLLNIYLFVLARPVLYFPYTASDAHGILTTIFHLHIAIQFYLVIPILVMLADSILLMFSFRLQVLLIPSSRWRISLKALLLLVGSHACIFTATFLVLLSFLEVEDEALTVYVRKLDSNFVRLVPNYRDFLWFDFQHPMSTVLIIIAVVGLSTIIVAIVASAWASISIVKRNVLTSSRNVAASRRQHRLIINQVLMVALPLGILAVPVFIIIIALCSGSPDTQNLVNLATYVVCLHSPLTSISTIFLTKPYRKALMRWVRCSSKKNELLRTRVSLIPSVTTV